MNNGLLILWLAEKLGASRFVSEPELIGWIFQPLRLITGAFLLVFVWLAALPAGGDPRRRQLAVSGLTCFGAGSLAAIALVGTGVFCFIVTSTTQKDIDVSEFRIRSWIFELMIWWSLVLLAVSVGAFRARRATPQRKING